MRFREYKSIIKPKSETVGLETSFNRMYLYKHCIGYLICFI